MPALHVPQCHGSRARQSNESNESNRKEREEEHHRLLLFYRLHFLFLFVALLKPDSEPLRLDSGEVGLDSEEVGLDSEVGL